MFVRMLAVHSDQNDSYELTMSGYQARKINEIRNVIFGLQLWETYPSVKAERSWDVHQVEYLMRSW